MSWFLCAAGVKLRAQIDARWPGRDHASDGSVGDASHQAVPSDHNPDWSAGGVVRAMDVDADLSATDADAMDRLARQLLACARQGNDNGRLSYVIWDHKIASGTYSSAFWTWRPYSGSNPHDHHMHVSFKPKADQRGGDFPLPIFAEAERAKRRRRRRLRRVVENLAARIRELRVRREQTRRKIRNL